MLPLIEVGDNGSEAEVETQLTPRENIDTRIPPPSHLYTSYLMVKDHYIRFSIRAIWRRVADGWLLGKNEALKSFRQSILMESRATEASYHRGKCKQGNDEHLDQDEQVEGLNTLASSVSQVPAIFDGMFEKLTEIWERFDEIERDQQGLHLREEMA
ncbi:hypothetical protein M5K25_026480 [Dendrobium thyrsiflorum]|uniref:Uncharacterized protein n=1 Tax=Dendrobium thyrsiflorum TaxID=117978 RepID=A0ABD0TXI7_DENTH